MHFDPLATTADLQDRDIALAPEDAIKAAAFLESASGEVRSAAGVPISRETFTVAIPGECDQWLHLPGQPVVIVTDVLIDGTATDDWKLVGGHLWRWSGWQPSWEPVEVTATLTGGLTEIPAEIVDLVCSMVGAALGKANEDGYASRGDLVGVRIDDYSEQYAAAAGDRLAGPMELPESTRNRLRARFGGSAVLVQSR